MSGTNEQITNQASLDLDIEQGQQVANANAAQAEVIIDGQVFHKTVLPAFTREDALRRNGGNESSLSMAGPTGPGTGPSRSLGSEIIHQTSTEWDPQTGRTTTKISGTTSVSRGARRSGVAGDISSSKSGL